MKILISLFALFVILPFAEICLLIYLVKTIEPIPTLMIVLLTGIVGAWLAKKNFSNAWKAFKNEMQAGKIPTEKIVDCALIFVAGVLLVTPGIITDCCGFALLIPAVRKITFRNVFSRVKLFSTFTDHPQQSTVNQRYYSDSNKDHQAVDIDAEVIDEADQIHSHDQ